MARSNLYRSKKTAVKSQLVENYRSASGALCSDVKLAAAHIAFDPGTGLDVLDADQGLVDGMVGQRDLVRAGGAVLALEGPLRHCCNII